MRSFQVIGIIIFKKDFGESDRLFHILTEHMGKIEVIAKNVRNGGKRAGHLELFNYGKFFLYKSKNHHYLNQCETIHEFPHLKNDLDSIGNAYFAAGILEKLLPLEDPHPDLLKETLEFLKILETSLKKTLAFLTFKVKFMTKMGILPELLQCHKCKIKLTPELIYIPQDHHYFCTNCTNKEGTRISPNTVKLYYYLRKAPLEDTMRIRTDKNLEIALNELTTLTDLYLQDHLG